MVYIFEDTDKLGEDFVSAALPLLSLQRTQKLDNYRLTADRVNCAAVFLLLRYALKNEYSINESPELTFGKNGKPYLKEQDSIFFSLSHSRNSCACILSESETAVDIADIRRISMHTAEYFCSEEELADIGKSEDPNTALVRLWAMKECYSKFDGSGLSMDFKSIGNNEFYNIHTVKGERYFAAYHSAKEESIVKPVLNNLLYT